MEFMLKFKKKNSIKFTKFERQHYLNDERLQRFRSNKWGNIFIKIFKNKFWVSNKSKVIKINQKKKIIQNAKMIDLSVFNYYSIYHLILRMRVLVQ